MAGELCTWVLHVSKADAVTTTDAMARALAEFEKGWQALPDQVADTAEGDVGDLLFKLKAAIASMPHAAKNLPDRWENQVHRENLVRVTHVARLMWKAYRAEDAPRSLMAAGSSNPFAQFLRCLLTACGLNATDKAALAAWRAFDDKILAERRELEAAALKAWRELAEAMSANPHEFKAAAGAKRKLNAVYGAWNSFNAPMLDVSRRLEGAYLAGSDELIKAAQIKRDAVLEAFSGEAAGKAWDKFVNDKADAERELKAEADAHPKLKAAIDALHRFNDRAFGETPELKAAVLEVWHKLDAEKVD